MSNLVPEKRMDRNGKLVTKHVRNGGPAPAARSAIPAPSVFSRPVITKERRPVYTAIMKASGKFKMSTSDWDSVRKNLLPLSDEELAEVSRTMDKFSSRLTSVNHSFMSVAIRNGYALEAARTAELICGGAETAGMTDPHRMFGDTLLGAMHLRMVDETFSIPEGQESKVRANVLVTEAILESCNPRDMPISKNVMGHLYLDDHELKVFVHDNADRADDMVRVIQERKTADVGTIREIMEQDVKSLTGGVL